MPIYRRILDSSSDYYGQIGVLLGTTHEGMRAIEHLRVPTGEPGRAHLVQVPAPLTNDVNPLLGEMTAAERYDLERMSEQPTTPQSHVLLVAALLEIDDTQPYTAWKRGDTTGEKPNG